MRRRAQRRRAGNASPPRLVSDHAVVRYLERVHGFDIDAIRAEIERITAQARRSGASAVSWQGFSFRLRAGVVVTVLNGQDARVRAQSEVARNRLHADLKKADREC